MHGQSEELTYVVRRLAAMSLQRKERDVLPSKSKPVHKPASHAITLTEPVEVVNDSTVQQSEIGGSRHRFAAANDVEALIEEPRSKALDKACLDIAAPYADDDLSASLPSVNELLNELDRVLAVGVNY